MTYTAPEWIRNAIFYQIFLDRFDNGDPSNDPPGVLPWGSPPTLDNFFGGDFQGIMDHLHYLEDLGVNTLYLTPIFKARTNHKYDTCDYMTIDPSFGTNQLFHRFVDEAHSRGIRVVLDAVFNHCGDGFWAFEDVKQRGAASKYKNWFYTTNFPIRQDPPNYQTCGGVAYLPKLKVTNPEVQEYLLKVATYWLREFDVDGWRLDVPWKVNLDFWRTFREVVKQINPDAYIVGEVWRDPRPWLQGDTCDGVMNYPLRNYILDYCVYDTMDAEDFDYEITLLRKTYGSSASAQLNLLSSHDTPRLLTLCKNDIARTIIAITFLFTYVGSPMIYYGDEIGLCGGNDPDCRRCMPWEEANWESELAKTYQKLIRARHTHRALRRGDFVPLLVFNGVYAYLRRFNNDEVIVILNPREERHQIKIPLGSTGTKERTWRNLLGEGIFKETEAHLQIETLLSKSALVLVPSGERREAEA
ncbi:MAG: alpha-amlyase [Anaerolinea sp.]|nr:alpha-amlyase [Anaerolinea sp.]